MGNIRPGAEAEAPKGMAKAGVGPEEEDNGNTTQRAGAPGSTLVDDDFRWALTSTRGAIRRNAHKLLEMILRGAAFEEVWKAYVHLFWTDRLEACVQELIRGHLEQFCADQNAAAYAGKGKTRKGVDR